MAMSKQKQSTLFSAFGGRESARDSEICVDPGPPATGGGEDPILIDDASTPEPINHDDAFQFDDFDEDFFADDVTEAELQQACQSPGASGDPGQQNCQKAASKGLKQSIIPFHIGPSAAAHSILNCSIIENEIPGFDLEAGEMWIYPTNYPVRDYQFNISKKVLFVNTLVCLPTGLGKTFIAAVLMYNFYRWYPTGKIVFLAPTKPLVAQQIEACYNVMGIPQEHAAEMTGE